MKSRTAESVTRALLCAGMLGLATRATAAATMVVKTAAAQQATLRQTTSQPATARAYHEAELHAKVSGYAASVKVDIGDRVKQGHVLLEIAVPEMVKSYEKSQAHLQLLQLRHERLKAQVNVAEAEFKALDSELSRVRQLLQTKSISQKVGDETTSRHASAKAQLEVARIESKSAAVEVEVARKAMEEIETLIAYATLKAPFAGVVTRRSIDPGDLVRDRAGSSAGEPLFVVARTDLLRVTVPIPERDAVWVNPGDLAEISFPALPGKTFKANVARTAGALDIATRTLTVEIDLPNPQGELLPGMYGTVVIAMREKTALIAPSDAIRFDTTGSKPTAFVVRNGTVSLTPVTVGMDDGHHIEILTGLKAGDELVTGLLGNLTDGQSVKVVTD